MGRGDGRPVARATSWHRAESDQEIGLLTEAATERKEWVFGYRKDGSPIQHFSPSSAKQYHQCGECFWLDKFQRTPTPTRVYLPQGSGVHKAFEYARKSVKKTGEYTMAKALEATARGFVKNLIKKLPDDAPVQDAVALLHQAIETGDVAVDLVNKYPSIQAAIADSQRWVEAAMPTVIDWERRIGYEAIEEPVLGYDEILPFKFGDAERERPVALDVMLAGTRIVDVKTSKDRTSPDWYTTWQLSLYALPWWKDGEPFSLSVVQIVKHAQRPFPIIYDLKVSDAQMKHALDELLGAADGIQRGSFPCRPSWTCKYRHDLPVYISLPLEMAA